MLLTVQMGSFARDLLCVCACACACVCVCVRETESHHSGVYSSSEIFLTAACVLQIHTSIITVSVTRLCSPFGLGLMVKLTWKLKLAIMVKIFTFPKHAWGVRPITMHWVSWPIRTDCACQKEGLYRKQRLRAAGHRGPTISTVFDKCFWTIKHVNIFCYTKYTKNDL